MKFGLLYELEMPKPWTKTKEREIFWEALDQIVLAEEMGFEYVWLVQHHFLTEFAHSCAPEVFLGAVSQRTEKIRLGFGVVLLPVDHPLRVAEYAATLDIMSKGRVDLGTGRGSTPYQLSPFGAHIKDTRAMWDEAVHLIPRMWTEEVFSHQGPFYDIPRREVIPKPVQEPHPPIWVAASQLDTFVLAGERGLGILCFTLGAPGELQHRVEAYQEAVKAPTKLVGDFVNNHVAGFTVAHCDENNQRGREICGEAGLWYLGNARTRYTTEWAGVDADSTPAEYRFHNPFSGGRGQLEVREATETNPNDLLDNGTFCGGDPDACIATAQKYEAAGLDQFMALMQAGRTPHDEIMKSIRLFGKHVIPYFQEKERKVPAAQKA